MMGHYRSEMGYDETDRREAEEKAKRHKRRADRIQEAIDERGVAAVLAEMVDDPILFKIRHS